MGQKLDHLHHVAVEVADIARAVAWYRSHFNVDVSYQDDTWALLDFDNVHLALVVPHQHPAHIAIPRADAADFGRLKSHRDGTRSVYIADSEGNAVEILASD